MLMSLLSALATAIVREVMDYWMLWFEAEKAQANEWEVKTKGRQLDSVAESVQAENAIRKVEHVSPKSPAEWNKQLNFRKVAAAMILGVTCFALCGCVKPIVFYAQRLPVIEMPERPVIPEDPPEFTERELMLADFAAALAARIEAYNDYAIDSNERNGYAGIDVVNVE